MDKRSYQADSRDIKTKYSGRGKSASLRLSDEEMLYPEELYTPHRPVGVMAQNNAPAP